MTGMISVIVPVYNTAPYLDQCVKSLVDQTYRGLEILLIDDCSTDGSGAIIDKWADADSRVSAIHNPTNLGVSQARNIGLDQACGEYIAFVDSDDFVSPELYERLLSLLEKHNAEVAVSSWYRIVNGVKSKVHYLPEDELVIPGPKAMDLCLSRIGERPLNMVIWNRLFRKEALFDSKGSAIYFDPAINYCEDVLWQANIFKRAKAIALCDEALYYHRSERFGNASTGLIKATKHTISAITVYREIYLMFSAGKEKCASNALQRSIEHRILGMQVSLDCEDRAIFRYCKNGFLQALLRWTILERNTYALKWASRKFIKYIFALKRAFRKKVKFFLIRTGLIRFFKN